MAELQLSDGLDFLHEYSTSGDPLDCATVLFSVKGSKGRSWLTSSAEIAKELSSIASRDVGAKDAEFVTDVLRGLRLSLVRKRIVWQFIA